MELLSHFETAPRKITTIIYHYIFVDFYRNYLQSFDKENSDEYTIQHIEILRRLYYREILLAGPFTDQKLILLDDNAKIIILYYLRSVQYPYENYSYFDCKKLSCMIKTIVPLNICKKYEKEIFDNLLKMVISFMTTYKVPWNGISDLFHLMSKKEKLKILFHLDELKENE